MRAGEPLAVVCVNYQYDPAITTPGELLDRYSTLTGWADGLVAAGARPTVVQRFADDAREARGQVEYHFVRDPVRRPRVLLDRADRLHRAVAALAPDVIHLNGLQFSHPGHRLKRLLPRIPILAQDHGGQPPEQTLLRRSLRHSLPAIDGVSFVAREQALPWIASGLLPDSTPVFELMEGSSPFRLLPRAAAREAAQLLGDPLCLWVGRLDHNKDPLTILKGFEVARDSLPGAHLAMAYGTGELLPEVRSWLSAHPGLSPHVTLLGKQPHPALELIYNSADLFVLGSQREGSGYAVLEALSCGVTPVITAIPSFRVLTGGGTIGGLWASGDAGSLARCLVERASRLQADTPQRVRQFFDEHFTWEAIGREAVRAYESLIEGLSP